MAVSANRETTQAASDERLWNVEECAAYLKVAPAAIYKLSMPKAESGFPVIRVGRRMRFRKTDIDQWLKERNGDRLSA